LNQSVKLEIRNSLLLTTSRSLMVFTCTLRRGKEGKHISCRRGEHSAKVQRLTLAIWRLTATIWVVPHS